jgi:ABC-2 type transport system permease protein
VNDIALAGRQGLYNLQGYMRNPRTLIFAAAMPVGFLILFNSVFGKAGATTMLFGGPVPITSFYAAGIAAYAVAFNSFSALLIGLVTEREAGRLKRYRGTPMPPSAFFAGQLLYSMVISSVLVVALLVIAILGYGVHIRAAALPALIVDVILGVFSLSAVAIAVSAWVTTTDMASSVGPFAVVALGFVSGAFLPLDLLPDVLRQVAQFFPLAPLTQGVEEVLVASSGSAFRLDSLLVSAAWGLVALFVALRTFNWMPTHAR